MQISRTCPLTLGDWVNFLPLTKPNPTDILGKVKVSQQTDASKCDQVVIIVNNNIIWFSHFLQQQQQHNLVLTLPTTTTTTTTTTT